MGELQALFQMMYPMHKPLSKGQDPTRNGRLGKLQLKCNKCGDLISRTSHRQWGNPMCGGCYRGGRDILELTYMNRPIFSRIGA